LPSTEKQVRGFKTFFTERLEKKKQINRRRCFRLLRGPVPTPAEGGEETTNCKSQRTKKRPTGGVFNAEGGEKSPPGGKNQNRKKT